LVDLYTFRGISSLISRVGVSYKTALFTGFWSVTGISLIWITWLKLSVNKLSYQEFYRYATFFMGFFTLFYIPKLVFIGFQFLKDIITLLSRIAGILFPGNNYVSDHALIISRSDFLLQIGIVIASIPFISIIWGIWKGKYNYRVKRLSLSFNNLPSSFNGMKIVQISDLHLGSFTGNIHKLEPAIKIINKLEPDYIFFTGDLINTFADEAEEFIPLLKSLDAKCGKYSILGNHDYGDYYSWSSEAKKMENFKKLVESHLQAGFKLLRNESVILENNNETIWLIGVENWGSPPFPQYGNLKKAYSSETGSAFKLLLSHDPSHWDAEVVSKTDIDLTLSGHTHGMQFAFRIPGWKWSPVQLKYPKWEGLYKEKDQYLYVNIGLGFIGFPGRVGTPPEITLLTLNKA
jgi:predicted MPP superfamily phosphohydrolase